MALTRRNFPLLAALKPLLKVRLEVRCPICGERIRGEGVERYGKRFCRSWHADFYRPPPPGGGACAGPRTRAAAADVVVNAMSNFQR